MTIQTLTAILPAAGCGARTGLETNKILAPLAAHTVLHWTLQALSRAKVLLAHHHLDLAECIIAARPEEFAAIEKILAEGDFSLDVHLVQGGATRQDSVCNAVERAEGKWVSVHDAARPLVSAQLIATVCKTALASGAAIAAVQASDTVKLAEGNGAPTVKSTFDRGRIWLAQTPQAFAREAFIAALHAAKRAGFQGTDCASVMEHQGHRVVLVAGESQNFKITYREDLERAEQLIEKGILQNEPQA